MQFYIFSLKMYIFSLDIYILSLKIYVSNLKIEFLYRRVEFCIACFCNMRMASMQYVNGIHAICELHLFLLREECFPFKKGINSSCERNLALQSIVI